MYLSIESLERPVLAEHIQIQWLLLTMLDSIESPKPAGEIMFELVNLVNLHKPFNLAMPEKKYITMNTHHYIYASMDII